MGNKCGNDFGEQTLRDGRIFCHGKHSADVGSVNQGMHERKNVCIDKKAYIHVYFCSTYSRWTPGGLHLKFTQIPHALHLEFRWSPSKFYLESNLECFKKIN